MKRINTYITEKLRINKNSKINDEANGNTLDEVMDWVHNDWDGETPFLVSKKLSKEDMKDLIEYMDQLDDNNRNDKEIHIHDYKNYNDKKYIINIYHLIDNEEN